MQQNIDSKIREVIGSMERPIESAHGLPASWYWDPEIFAVEQERIFKRTWMAVCFSHEIANTGDVYPAKVAGAEVVIVRSPDGSASAFHNICRHRAAKVVPEPATALRTLRCSYHCWTYGLDGKLRNAPYFEGNPSYKPDAASSEKDNLVPIRCDEWQGIVFINLDGKAQSLHEYVNPLAKRWADYETESLPVYKTAKSHIPVNWKVVMEGALEVYHEHFIHKSLTYRLTSEGEKAWEDILEGEVMGFRSVMSDDNPDHPPMTLPRVPGMPTEGAAPTEICLLFPSVSLNILDNHFVRTIWTFDSVKETSWKSDWMFAPGAAETEQGKADCNGVVDFWLDVRKEDLGAVVSVQAGLESKTDFPIQTRYSPFWEPILQHFHLHIAKGLQQE
ncbi:aromatic ring-hydroxylating dioxygenase subunit alpha [Limibacillus sp. MBR-115]|jgi:choline monooxygenase|uniref:aromatic ring-hydroxylating oxygenase subunit alpha n=1 Tax=Limibacillus sp. MBR-115 TaxID=3156465 RepID=UPI00339A597B